MRRQKNSLGSRLGSTHERTLYLSARLAARQGTRPKTALRHRARRKPPLLRPAPSVAPCHRNAPLVGPDASREKLLRLRSYEHDVQRRLTWDCP